MVQSLISNNPVSTGGMNRQRPKRRKLGLGKASAASILSALFVLGVSIPAEAATTTYANTSTVRNQTITSSTHAMNGGSVAATPGSQWEQTRATVVGVGNFNGLGSTTTNYTHARVTTQVYCQWRNDSPPPWNTPAGTRLTLNCKYTY